MEYYFKNLFRNFAIPKIMNLKCDTIFTLQTVYKFWMQSMHCRRVGVYLENALIRSHIDSIRRNSNMSKFC